MLVKSEISIQEFAIAMQEYFEMGHAEPSPVSDLKKPVMRYTTFHCIRLGKNPVQQARFVSFRCSHEELVWDIIELLVTCRTYGPLTSCGHIAVVST